MSYNCLDTTFGQTIPLIWNRFLCHKDGMVGAISSLVASVSELITSLGSAPLTFSFVLGLHPTLARASRRCSSFWKNNTQLHYALCTVYNCANKCKYFNFNVKPIILKCLCNRQPNNKNQISCWLHKVILELPFRLLEGRIDSNKIIIK